MVTLCGWLASEERVTYHQKGHPKGALDKAKEDARRKMEYMHLKDPGRDYCVLQRSKNSHAVHALSSQPTPKDSCVGSKNVHAATGLDNSHA
ncbi:hypothetical protein Tco_1237548 [Tanacetum coccineum]|uniref:Uncharacterized protein n=1 Tax=Tanacetum coccineum TaxID=301880 RepID=A0ABQ5HRA9_9ASTR